MTNYFDEVTDNKLQSLTLEGFLSDNSRGKGNNTKQQTEAKNTWLNKVINKLRNDSIGFTPRDIKNAYKEELLENPENRIKYEATESRLLMYTITQCFKMNMREEKTLEMLQFTSQKNNNEEQLKALILIVYKKLYQKQEEEKNISFEQISSINKSEEESNQFKNEINNEPPENFLSKLCRCLNPMNWCSDR